MEKAKQMTGGRERRRAERMGTYDVMKANGFASFCASMNGYRYISLRARSETTESAAVRSCSWSLATKCLMVAATPLVWRPLTYAAAIMPERCGSSENDSKARPPNGLRWMLPFCHDGVDRVSEDYLSFVKESVGK